MKPIKYFYLFFLSLLIFSELKAQYIIFEGEVICEFNDKQHNGAEMVLIYPDVAPKSVTGTEGGTFGYYAINTKLKYEKLLDENVVIKTMSNCGSKLTTIFVSIDRLKYINGNYYLIVPETVFKRDCDDLKLDITTFESKKEEIKKIPPKKIKKSAFIGTEPVNIFKLLPGISIPCPFCFIGQNTPDYIRDTTTIVHSIDSLGWRKNKIGFLPLLGSSVLTSNIGFNFAPYRNQTEAVFWNSSALAFKNDFKNFWFSSFSNYVNFASITAGFKIGKKINISSGANYLVQSELVDAYIEDQITLQNIPIENNEYVITLGASYLINPKLSFGLSGKLYSQLLFDTNFPTEVDHYMKFSGYKQVCFYDDGFEWCYDGEPIKSEIVYSKLDREGIIKRKKADIDLSLSYFLNNKFQIGLNIANVLNSKVYQDYTVEKQRKKIGTHYIGLGANYKYKRLNIGADFILNNKEYNNLILGLSYISKEDIKMDVGFSLSNRVFSFALKYKFIHLTFINSPKVIEYKKDFLRSRDTESPLTYLYSGFNFKF